MSANKRILLLHAGSREQGALDKLVRAMTALGSLVDTADLDLGRYDEILDAVARADTVIYWPAGSSD